MGFDVKLELDTTQLDNLQKHCNALNKRHIKFGWINKKNYSANSDNRGVSIAQVAFWQEYGLGGSQDSAGIPSRPYFRQSINEFKNIVNPKFVNLFSDAIKGNSTLPILNDIAKLSVDTYHNNVAKQNHKKLAPYTVALKGHSYQMVDSGEMTKSFKAKVYRIKLSDSDGGI